MEKAFPFFSLSNIPNDDINFILTDGVDAPCRGNETKQKKNVIDYVFLDSSSSPTINIIWLANLGKIRQLRGGEKNKSTSNILVFFLFHFSFLFQRKNSRNGDYVINTWHTSRMRSDLVVIAVGGSFFFFPPFILNCCQAPAFSTSWSRRRCYRGSWSSRQSSFSLEHSLVFTCDAKIEDTQQHAKNKNKYINKKKAVEKVRVKEKPGKNKKGELELLSKTPSF